MRITHKRVALVCMLALAVSAEISSTAIAQSLTGNETRQRGRTSPVNGVARPDW